MSVRTPATEDSVSNAVDAVGSNADVNTLYGGTDYYGSNTDISGFQKDTKSERAIPKFIDRRLPPPILRGMKTKKKKSKNKKDKTSLPLKDIETAIAAELKEHRQAEEERILKEDQERPHFEIHLAYLKKETNLFMSLGRVYLERGKVTKACWDFIKASALYNAASLRLRKYKEIASSTENVEKRLRGVEAAFLAGVTQNRTATKGLSQETEQRHLTLLDRLRRDCERELDDLKNNCDPSTAGGDDEWQNLQKTKRVRATRCLYQNIAEKMGNILQAFVEECMEGLGEPPCTYAVLGLGAIAKQEITPYSEIEFAILVEDDSAVCKKYFRMLTAYMYIKILSLEETPLHWIGIKSLNDLMSPHGDWYFDTTTPRGISFDRHLPWASRTPLGREAIGKKPAIELIKTPEGMAILLAELSSDKEGQALADSLGHACFVCGDQSLEIDYRCRKSILLESSRTTIKTELESLNTLTFPTIGSERARSILIPLVTKFTMGIEGDKKRYTVGKDLHAFLRIVYGLADYFGAQYSSPWEAVDDLRRKRILSADAMSNLHVVISFILERRLRHHVQLHNAEKAREKSKVYDSFTDVATLFNFYNVMLPLCDAVQRTLFSVSDENVDRRALMGNPLFDNSLKTRAEIHLRLKQFVEAEVCLRELLRGNTEDHTNLVNVICVIFKTGKLNKTDEKPDSGLTDDKSSETAKDVVVRRPHKKNVSPRSRILKDATFNYNAIGKKDSPRSIIPKEKLEDKSSDTTPRSNKTLQITTREDDKDPQRLLQARLSSFGGLKVLLTQAENSILALFEGSRQPKATTELAVLLNNLAVAWYHFGDPRKTLLYFQRALQLWKEVYAENHVHPNISDILNKIGVIQSDLGKLDSAVDIHMRALEILIKLSGGNKEDPELAITLNFLGNAYRSLNALHKALACHDESIHIFRRIHGNQVAHPEVAVSLDHLGCMWQAFADIDKAKDFHSMALDMYSNSTSEVSLIQISDCMSHIGECHRASGDFKEAVTHFARALNLYEYVFGKEIPNSRVAKTRGLIGKVWDSLGEHKDAISYYEQAHDEYKKVYGDDYPHPSIASTYADMGNSWDSLGDYKKAIIYHEKALSVFTRLYGIDAVNVNIAKTLSDLGNAAFALGDSHNSISYHERALKMCRKVFGEKTAHAHIASSLVNLGSAWGTLGEYRKTISYLDEALDMYRRIFGKPRPVHHDVAASLSNLGNAWDALGDAEKAVLYHEEALAMKREIYGESVAHRDVAWSFNNLGNAYDSLKNYKKAEQYYRQALEMKVKLYGSETPNPEVARAMHNIGSVLDKRGEYIDALKFMEAALGMYSHILPYGAVHPDVSLSLHSMGLVQTHLGQHAKAILYHKESLIMKRLLFGESAAHPDIVQSLKELAFLYCAIKDVDTGIAYYNEAVEMAKVSYGEGHEEYREIKEIRDNLLSTFIKYRTRST
ncbi:uncharacterized protein [Ptychodera flava]|uniref:uncharacterized protein n=1 Tax=Ptychodera flava TaxID=63121 RepID=UPI00396A4598